MGRALAVPCALAVGWIVVAAPAPGHANGRFPAAGQLVVDPVDGLHIVVRATFGLLQSFDAGATWSWICERAASPDGLQDPEVIVTTGGRVAMALPDGLAVGDRSGCQWSRAPGLAGVEIIDLVASRADPATAHAVAVVRVGGAFNGLVAGTTDGVSWSADGDLLPDTYPLTIEIAASRPRRLYLGANDGNLELGFIAVSDDGGASWIRHDSPAGVDSVYVSAVDAEDPERLYARSYSPQSNLYVSEDGALSWTLIDESPVPLTAFALSPDGRQIALGGQDGLTIIARTPGVDRSAYTVTATNPLPVSCLTWTARGLFACANEASAGFTIGLSTDGGGTFAPLLRLADLTPASCAAGTSAAVCAADWCPTAAVIGAACAPAVDGGGDGGNGDGGNGDGGNGDRRRADTVGATGCACAAPGGQPSGAVGSILVASAWMLIRTRARRRQRRRAVRRTALTSSASDGGADATSNATLWLRARTASSMVNV